MYDDYLSGTGLPMIAEGLNLRGFTGTKGGKWTTTTVIGVLDQGFGAGLIVHRGEWVQGAHEPVIDQATWDAYKARRQKLRRVPTRMRSPVHSTSGLAVCGYCGSNMIAASSRRQGKAYILRCSNMQSRGLSACAGVQIVRHAVEEAVREWLGPLSEAIDEATRVAHEHRQKVEPSLPSRTGTEQVLRQLEARLRRLTDALEIGSLPAVEYQERRDRIEAQLTAHQETARVAEELPELLRTGGTARLLRDWNRLETGVIRDVLGVLIERIVCFPHGDDPRVVIVPRFPQGSPSGTSLDPVGEDRSGTRGVADTTRHDQRNELDRLDPGSAADHPNAEARDCLGRGPTRPGNTNGAAPINGPGTAATKVGNARKVDPGTGRPSRVETDPR